MVKEAEKFAEEDKKRKALVDARNEADSLIYSAEKSIKDLGDKLEASKKEEVEKAISSLREAAQGEDLSRINSAKEELTKHMHELSSKLYENLKQQQEGGGTGESNAQGSGGKTVDADYEEKEE